MNNDEKYIPSKNFLYRFFGHLKTVCVHRFWVCYFCFKAGLYWQGLTHDLSKFNPIEFFEGVKYFVGNDSPINVCKKYNGVSIAWFHHRGRNLHHYENWIDGFDFGGHAVPMPYKYALEMVCDYLAAGKAYMKKNFTYDAEYRWWLNKIGSGILLHEHTKSFVGYLLNDIRKSDSLEILKYKNSKPVYDFYCSGDWCNK